MDNQYIINPLSLHAILNFSFFFRYILFRSVSFVFVSFCLISFRFFLDKIRFVTFRFVSFRFVWFRFVSFRFALYRYPIKHDHFKWIKKLHISRFSSWYGAVMEWSYDRMIVSYCYEFAVTRNRVCLLFEILREFSRVLCKQNHLTTGRQLSWIFEVCLFNYVYLLLNC